MKKMLLAILSLLQLNVFAQITVGASTFPGAGDTLNYAIDDTPDGIDLAPAPGLSNHTWDFSGLDVINTSIQVYRNANQGMSTGDFPGSDLVVLGQVGETYYNVTATRFEVMGYVGDDPAGFGIDIPAAKFIPAVIERRAPLNFFDINQQETKLTLPLGVNTLPDTLANLLSGFTDSIRITINTKRLEVVDGWGNCKIPGGTYPVLRQKRTDFTATGAEIKLPFIGWQDVSNFIPSGGNGFGGLLGTDTTISFRFYNNIEKEEIAVATMSNDLSTVETVRFKDLMTTPSFEPAGFAAAAIQAYPNPAVEWVRFDCTNLPQDEYTIKIYNIIGKVIWKENYSMAGNKSVRLELEDFKKGTYLYSLVDSKGNTLSTKRLVILKP